MTERVLNHIQDKPGLPIYVIAQDLGLSLFVVSGYLAALKREELIREVEERWIPNYQVETESLWGYQRYAGACDRCIAYAERGTFTEKEIFAEFPWLRKVGRNIWKPMVHPHCFCELYRLLVII